MWVFGRIMESIPLELGQYTGKSEEEIFLSSKAGVSNKLHNNILTPHNIPEFCLPPRLCKRSPLLEKEMTTTILLRQNHTSSNAAHDKMEDMEDGDLSLAYKARKKPLPFSAEGYGLAGIYESPNTRRKESLFHSKRPLNVFDRSLPPSAPRLQKVTNLPKNTLSGFFSLFSAKSMSETGSTGSETSSSIDSSPTSSPYSAKSSLYFPPGSGRLKETTSCPSLTDSTEDSQRWKNLKTSPSSPPSLKGSSLTLAPPVLFPLDVLQCQERLQHEHVLPLQSCGKVCLYAEYSTFPTNTYSSLSTVRVHVVSVEGLLNDSDRQTLNCSVHLCLTPGKLQQQESATIRNCCSPVFKEDFFFTKLSREDLQELQLRIKVVDKPAARTLRRGTVIGVITKPLSQLLLLTKQVEE